MIFHSSIEPLYYILPLIGLVIGLFGTLLGGGGGFFFLPILTLLFNVPTQTAVITSLVATLPICIVGSLGHYRKNNIDFRIGSLFAVAGIIGAFIGAGITNILSATQLKISFGIYSLFIALNMVYSTWKKNHSKQQTIQENKKIRNLFKGSFFGFFAGIITGTFGTSGTAPILAGLFSIQIPLKMVIGTSLMVVLVNTLFAVSAHFLVSSIDLTLVYFLTAVSIIGAISGPKILSNIKVDQSENKIKYWYAVVMVVLGFLMITK